MTKGSTSFGGTGVMGQAPLHLSGTSLNVGLCSPQCSFHKVPTEHYTHPGQQKRQEAHISVTQVS